MLFSQQGPGLLVVQERYSRLVMLIKIPNKESEIIISHLINIFSCLPKEFAKSMTFDNGTEFARHYQLKPMGIKTYFCDVRSPWQKGGIENAIGRLRHPLPRKINIAELTTKEIEEVVALYNHTPRKCLEYKTPAEIFINKLLHFKCELTSPHSRG